MGEIICPINYHSPDILGRQEIHLNLIRRIGNRQKRLNTFHIVEISNRLAVVTKRLSLKNYCTAFNPRNSNEVNLAAARKCIGCHNVSRAVGCDSRENLNSGVCGKRRHARQKKNDKYSHKREWKVAFHFLSAAAK
jgi:hypothetical protein